MKLEVTSPNYAATIVRTRVVLPLERCDNLVGLPFFGMQAIVSIGAKEGELGILFPTEAQLSNEFCEANNLFRHAELNIDKAKQGYLEDNRRVRAIKLRGNRSDALFMSLDSLAYLGIKTNELIEGQVFNTINGHEVCRKYFVPVRVQGPANKIHRVRDIRVEGKHMPEQPDIHHFLREVEGLPQDAPVIVTQKLHGANIRIANIIVRRRLTIRDRIAKMLGVRVQEQTYDYIYGSHKVIKDAESATQQHYYDFDIWSLEGAKLKGLIPTGFILYGELVGWTPTGRAIQPGYTYNLPPSEAKIYIYRIATVNQEGFLCDLSWDAVREFCKNTGIAHVPELCRTSVNRLTEGLLEVFTDARFTDFEWSADPPVPLAPQSPCDEGICIRLGGLKPIILKYKSPTFVAHETRVLDTGEANIEETT